MLKEKQCITQLIALVMVLGFSVSCFGIENPRSMSYFQKGQSSIFQKKFLGAP